jgi:hypothetical protein
MTREERLARMHEAFERHQEAMREVVAAMEELNAENSARLDEMMAENKAALARWDIRDTVTQLQQMVLDLTTEVRALRQQRNGDPRP